MIETYLTPRETQRFERPLLIAGAVLLALCFLGAFFSPLQFFHSYLLGYMLWLGIALGCLAVLMLQHLSGGAWGVVIRRVLEAATRTLPAMAALFVPLLFGIKSLYIWARPEVVAADPVLQAKHLYLNVPFFLARVVFYFAVWVTVAGVLNRLSLRQDQSSDPLVSRRLQLLSAGGLLLYAVTITFASIDWVMSLEPHWFSTIFGMIFMAGQGLGALAFATAVIAMMSRREPFAGVVTSAHLHDLGNLMLAFVMLWSYMSFSQYLLIWAGNLPEEIPWYVHRLTGGWQLVGLVLVLFHFCVPFVLLLSRAVKRNPTPVLAVAVGVLVMRLVDLFWMIGPEAHTAGLHVHWMDVVAPAGLGAVWLALFASQLRERPLLPLGDPQLATALEQGRH